MKQHFSSLDVKVIAHELSQTLPSLRLSNVYDLSSRIFLFKFHKPSQREQLLIETGFRCHLTSFARSAAPTPSAFVTRLRKFLRSRRVTAVRQLGTDRIIEIVFGDGQYRLFLEFYAGGNIVLTDGELNILALFRSVSEEKEGEDVKVDAKYRVDGRPGIDGVETIRRERLVRCLEEGKKRDDAEEKEQSQADTAGQLRAGKKSKKRKVAFLKRALSGGFTEFPPALIEHVLLSRSIDSQQKPAEILKDENFVDVLLESLREAEKTVASLTGDSICKGHILAKPRKPRKELSGDLEDQNELVYEEFQPFLPHQYGADSTWKSISVEGYNATVDKFFSSLESQKLVGRLLEREENAKRKLETARKDHENRIGALKKDQQLNVRKAQAIEANIERVDEASAAVNGLIAQGMDWMEIAKLIEMEQERDNPVALMIKLPLKLYENTVTLLLGELEDEGEADFEGDQTDEDSSESEKDSKPPLRSALKKPQQKIEDKRLAIDIDLALSSWSNAEIYYDQKRHAAVKEQKTAQSSEKALKNHEKKVLANLKKGLKTEKDVLRPIRQQFWFEKFWFFISSEGYLVLGGKDPQQIELIYRKYFRRGDIFVHCQVNGSVPLIIKNHKNTPDAPIPPSTLSQAGTYAISTSTAWESKAVMSAWWAAFEQVSKLAPTGDVLSPGNFYIKGEKNYLPPSQLVLGFGVLFQIDEESKKNHFKNRAPLDAETGTDNEKVSQEAKNKVEGPVDQKDQSIGDSSSDDEDFPDVDADSDGGFGNGSIRLAPSNPLQSLAHKHAQKETPKTRLDVPKAGKKQGEKNIPPLSDSKVAAPGSDSEGTPNYEEEEDEEDDAEDDNPPSQNPTSTAPSSTSSKTKMKQLPRGARTKAKRAAQKYKDQDEEDRELAIRLLGSTVGEERRRLEAAAKAEKAKELEDIKRRKDEAKKRALENARAAEEKKILAAEGKKADDDGVDGDDEEATEDIDLGAFITNPLPGDQVLAAVPMCAPWGALGRAKYKAKLQPGTTKKSKAVKQVLFAWGGGEGSQAETEGKSVAKMIDETSKDTEKAWPVEIEGIRGWKETEVIGSIPARLVRVNLGGVIVRAGNTQDSKGKGGKGGGSGGKNKGGGGKKKK